MRAHEICAQAAHLVSGERDRTHGAKRRNHENIAQFWNAYLRAKFDCPFNLTALDAANMMEALKIARRCYGAHNADDYVDAAGYAACAGEIAAEDNA